MRLSIVHAKPVNSWKVASSFLKHPPTLTVVGKGDVLTEEPVEDASPEQPAEPPRLSWSDNKNEQLKQERGMSFEQVVHAFAAGRVLAALPHPNQTRYPNQRMLLIDIEGYVYVVPCVPTGEGFFLKPCIRVGRPLGAIYTRGETTLSNVNWRPETEEEETEMMKHLDPEERAELEAFNKMLSDPGFVPQQMDPDQIAYWKQIADNTLALSESVTAPLTANDMSALRVRAAEEGLTPEALAGSLLHKALKGLSR